LKIKNNKKYVKFLSEHTEEELEEIYFTKKIDEDQFIEYGNKMLDAVLVFWNDML